MSVTIAFALTDQTGVGFTGFVEQIPIPIPPAVWLFASGLLGLMGIARRRKQWRDRVNDNGPERGRFVWANGRRWINARSRPDEYVVCSVK